MNDTDIPCPYCGHALPQQSNETELTPSLGTCVQCGGETVIDGRYRLVGLLGLGAVSVVYEAERLEDGREVALKVLQQEYVGNKEAEAAFADSTDVLQQLHHAQVPEVYDFFRMQSHNLQVFVSEALEGGTLHDRLFEEARRLEPERIERFFLDMLNMLSCLQEQASPIIHRYIQPSNVMFRTRDDWIPILVDFDHILADEMQPRFHRDYMPPEQLDGKVSQATDMYSLALTVLVLATGKEPHQLKAKSESFDVHVLAPELPKHIRQALNAMLDPHLRSREKSAHKILDRFALMQRTNQLKRRVMMFTLIVLVLGAVLGIAYKSQSTTVSQDSAGVVKTP